MKRPREISNTFLYKLSCSECDFNKTLEYIKDLEYKLESWECDSHPWSGGDGDSITDPHRIRKIWDMRMERIECLEYENKRMRSHLNALLGRCCESCASEIKRANDEMIDDLRIKLQNSGSQN